MGCKEVVINLVSEEPAIQLQRQGIIIKPIKGERAVFNPGAAYSDGKIHLLYRIVASSPPGSYFSRLGHAISYDKGLTYQRQQDPEIVYASILSPETIQQLREWEHNGVEDPRLVEIEGTWHITMVYLKKPAFSLNQQAITVVARTNDFHTYEVQAILTPQEMRDKGDNRDTVLLPKIIDGQYWMLHRPQEHAEIINDNGVMTPRFVQYGSKTGEPTSIWVSSSADLSNMPSGDVILRPQNVSWEKLELGPGPSPIDTNAGWLILYNVVANKKFRVGAALLDHNNPRKVTHRLPYFLIEADEDYEVHGDACDNVVFNNGAVVVGDKLMVYYGGGDRVCALASCSLDELIKQLQANTLSPEVQ